MTVVRTPKWDRKEFTRTERGAQMGYDTLPTWFRRSGFQRFDIVYVIFKGSLDV